MLRVRRANICHAPNSFTPYRLLWQLFITAQEPPLSRALRTSSVAYQYPNNAAEAQKIAAANKRQHDDIIPNDLPATLEAHRESNRGTLIRKLVPADWRRGEALLKEKTHLGYDGAETPGKEITTSKNSPKSPNRKVRSSVRDEHRRQAQYKGEVVLPLVPLSVPEFSLPWMTPESPSDATPAQRLSQEITAFYSYIIPTPNEELGRQSAISEAKAITQKALSVFKGEQYSTEVFGSQRTGLALSVSDVDLRVYHAESATESDPEKAPRYEVRKKMMKKLQTVYRGIMSAPEFYLTQIRHARYPLISTLHKQSSLDMQIVASNDTSLSRQFTQKYLDEFPGLAALFALVKVTLEIRGLTDVFRGGMGSYSLFMMIVASLKMTPDLPKNDLGQSLLAFLKFWTNFDMEKAGVSINPLEIFDKREQKPVVPKKVEQKLRQNPRHSISLLDEKQPYLLCLQDPADATNDLGRKTFGIKHIICTLTKLEDDLTRQLMNENYEGSFIAPFVGPSYELWLSRRTKLEEYGASIAKMQRETPPSSTLVSEEDISPPPPNPNVVTTVIDAATSSNPSADADVTQDSAITTETTSEAPSVNSSTLDTTTSFPSPSSDSDTKSVASP